jgi:hypothetical protein
MKLVWLQGVLMDNGEFISDGKSIFLTKKQIEKYIKEEVKP